MPRKKLIIVASDKMDSNKKQDRNEDGLLRMSAKARNNMGYKDEVEVYPNTKDISRRLNGAMMLTIFQAFSSDIKRLRKEGSTEEELQRTAFVTSRTFQKIVGRNNEDSSNIWITDEIEDTVIGSDPEFLLFNRHGEVVGARSVMGYNGPIGCDGAMAEVRPEPAITPGGLTSNIRKIFADKKLTESIIQYDWIAGCYFKDNARDYPIGGHIHIGNPSKVASMGQENRRIFFMAFNKVLDELLAIPMIRVDGSKCGGARRNNCAMGKYGYFGGLRLCAGRLEYRTLSGMWLMHPKLTELVFGTAKAIIDEVYRQVAHNKFSTEYMVASILRNSDCWNKNFNSWQSVPLTKDLGCTRPSAEMIGLLNNSSPKEINLKALYAWYQKMRSLSTYKTYAKYIDGLYEVLKSKPAVFEKINKELKTNWLNGGKFI